MCLKYGGNISGNHGKVEKLQTKLMKLFEKLDTVVLINLVELIQNDLSTRFLLSLSATAETDEQVNLEIGLFKSRERKLAVVTAIREQADPHAALRELDEKDSIVN